MAGRQSVQVMDVFRKVSGQQQAIVRRQRWRNEPSQLEHDGRAVAGQGIVKAWRAPQAIGRIQILQKQRADFCLTYLQPIEINVLASRITARTHNVTLIGGYQDLLE